LQWFRNKHYHCAYHPVSLFRGVGIVQQPVIEEGYVLALNKDNKVTELTPAQIKDVFDEEITNWNEVGGQDMPIRLSVWRISPSIIPKKNWDLLMNTPEQELPSWWSVHRASLLLCRNSLLSGKTPYTCCAIIRFQVKDVFAGAEWFPTATPAAQFGFLPLITGTLWVSLFAILIALPFGLSVAIYMSEVANPKVRNLLKPIIELLSGIPSVVYGFFGLIVIVPLIQKVFDLPVGESGLAGSIVLAIMALPTIITVTEDAMRNCPSCHA